MANNIIPRGTPPTPVPARTAKHRTIDRLLSMLSIWPFRNKAYVRSLETAREVEENQNKLENAIIDHGRTRGRLNDLEITLAQDRLERRRLFTEEQRRSSTALNDSMLDGELVEQKNKLKKGEVKMQEEEQWIQRMEQQTRKIKAKRELEEVKKPQPPPAPPAPRDRSEKRKLREEAREHFDNEIRRIDKMKKAMAQRKADLKQEATNDLERELQKIENMP
jgi:hypothetical protein